MPDTSAPRVLLVVGGGIAAYKSLELIRLLRRAGAEVQVILTRAGAEFVTPLSLATLSEKPVRSELLSLGQESEIGHIRLAREADCIVVAPATADLLARMAAGRADDLASACLLAAERPPLVAPAMNPAMWNHPATRDNVRLLRARGVRFLGPEVGDTACGEDGLGRMSEAQALADAVLARLALQTRLRGVRVLTTAGPTREALDGVRFLSNRSSGRQGFAIAQALAELGADTHLVCGPCALEVPAGVSSVAVESAEAMLAACLEIKDVDVAVCAAAVSDWRFAERHDGKLPKEAMQRHAALAPTPDILARIARVSPSRPRLVVGFAAEIGSPEERRERAEAKRRAKGCDWILVNDASREAEIVGGAENQVELLSDSGAEPWPRLPKEEVAARLALRIAEAPNLAHARHLP